MIKIKVVVPLTAKDAHLLLQEGIIEWDTMVNEKIITIYYKYFLFQLKDVNVEENLDKFTDLIVERYQWLTQSKMKTIVFLY